MRSELHEAGGWPWCKLVASTADGPIDVMFNIGINLRFQFTHNSAPAVLIRFLSKSQIVNRVAFAFEPDLFSKPEFVTYFR
jgi:hypothetical protein